MFNQIKAYFKLKSYTLRFSILSIFVMLLIISMTSLIWLMYVRTTNNITYFAFDLMKQISRSVFTNIDHEFDAVEKKNQSAALVLRSDVIDLNITNNTEIFNYAIHILENEGSLFPLLNNIVWTDQNGNVIIASKQKDGTITLEEIYQYNNKKYHHFIYRNTLNNTFKIVDAPPVNYNVKTRPWYIAALKNKKTTWLDVYRYYFTQELGISVVTPVITKDEKIVGVIKFDIGIEFIRKLIEDVKFSKNGIIFIVSKSGKLIAYPNIVQYKNNNVMDIHQLSNRPWIIASYDYFIKTGKTNFKIEINNVIYLASYSSFATIGDSEWFVATVAPQDDFVSGLRGTRRISILFGLLILIASIIVVSSVISRVVKPMKKITNEIDKIKNFELTNTPKIVSRITEINAVASALYSMKKGLRSFQKYIPASLVRDLIEAGDEAQTGGVKKYLAIFFTDIRNFTSIAEASDPHKLAMRLCDYFNVLSTIIAKQNGTIDKYIGDAVMAFWGAPLDIDNPCHKAATAALLCINQINLLNHIWENENKPPFITTIGIHFGEAVVGNYGSTERLSYTAFGDAVNLASRLQGLNQYFGTHIIVSEAVYLIIKDDFTLRMIDCVTVKGKEEAINIYELISENGKDVGYDIDAYRKEFSEGFSDYLKMHWDEALIHFNHCKSIYKEDVVSQLFIARCEKYKQTPPSENWHGVWHLDKKPI